MVEEVRGWATRLLKSSNPIAILLGLATVFREQIGGVVNGSVVYAGTYNGCTIQSGGNPSGDPTLTFP
jgi:hypothetical protein